MKTLSPHLLKTAVERTLERGAFKEGHVTTKVIRKPYGTNIEVKIVGDLSQMDCVSLIAESAHVSGAQIIKPFTRAISNGRLTTTFTFRKRSGGIL